jgi:hypothetical protein
MTPGEKAPRLPGRGAKVNDANVPKVGTFGNNNELSRDRASSYEVVPPIGECWSFSLLYQAESKFERIVAQRNGGLS